MLLGYLSLASKHVHRIWHDLDPVKIGYNLLYHDHYFVHGVPAIYALIYLLVVILNENVCFDDHGEVFDH